MINKCCKNKNNTYKLYVVVAEVFFFGKVFVRGKLFELGRWGWLEEKRKLSLQCLPLYSLEVGSLSRLQGRFVNLLLELSNTRILSTTRPLHSGLSRIKGGHEHLQGAPYK